MIAQRLIIQQYHVSLKENIPKIQNQTLFIRKTKLLYASNYRSANNSHIYPHIIKCLNVELWRIENSQCLYLLNNKQVRNAHSAKFPGSKRINLIQCNKLKCHRQF